MVSVQSAVSVQSISLFFRCHGSLFIYTPFLFSFFFFSIFLFLFILRSHILLFFRPKSAEVRLRVCTFLLRGKHKKCDIMHLFLRVCVIIFSLSSAVEGYAAEVCDTFQSSHFFTVVLAVLIHLSNVVLQLSDFSCRVCEQERHKDRVRLLHEPSFSQ